MTTIALYIAIIMQLDTITAYYYATVTIPYDKQYLNYFFDAYVNINHIQSCMILDCQDRLIVESPHVHGCGTKCYILYGGSCP